MDQDIRIGEPAEGLGSSQADLAYRRLEEAIVTLRLAPGSMVTEAQAIEIAKLGRTPVREALLRLAQHGMIGILPRKGLSIRPVDPVDLLSVLDIRQAIENAMIVSATTRASSAERREILHLAEGMREAALAGDVVTYMQRDKLLDEVIALGARNPYGARALEPLQTLMRRAWYVFERDHDLTPAALLHLAIARAIAVADVPAAGAACDALIAHMRDGLRQQVRPG